MLQQYLLIAAFFICLVGFSQKDKPIITDYQKQVQEIQVFNPNPYSELGHLVKENNITVHNDVDLLWEEIIGYSHFDKQAHRSIDNRFCSFHDNQMGAVYNFGSPSGAPDFEEMGTGYAFYDGYDWSETATSRIESERCGWPSIAPYGEDGEIVVSHLDGTNSGNVGLVFNTRPVCGTGDWTEIYYSGPNGLPAKFPRIVTNGANNEIIHLLYSFMDEEYEYIKNPGLYSRSDDGGTTWAIQDVILDGMTCDEYLSIGDIMVWAEPKGETIAFAFADTWSTDLAIMKSDNNGDDWDKTIIWEHPYPFFEWETTIMTEPMWAPDGGISIDIDENEQVHLAASLCRVFHNEPGYNYISWPYAEGIVYWKEGRPIFEEENQHDALNAWNPQILEPDVELLGWGQDVNNDGVFSLINDSLFTYPNTIGATTMPALACGTNGRVSLYWCSPCESCTYCEAVNYRHVYQRWGFNNGENWGNTEVLFSHIVMTVYESIWPIANKGMDWRTHTFFMVDYDVGTAFDGNHGFWENRFEYYDDYLVSNPEILDNQTESFEVSQNHPNPANGKTIINIETTANYQELKLEITSTKGQLIYQEKQNSSKLSHSAFVVDVSGFAPGIYFYSVSVDGKSITKKMIID